MVWLSAPAVGIHSSGFGIESVESVDPPTQEYTGHTITLLFTFTTCFIGHVVRLALLKWTD
jgi:hypothetical protein